jgi:hypothetical protein
MGLGQGLMQAGQLLAQGIQNNDKQKRSRTRELEEDALRRDEIASMEKYRMKDLEVRQANQDFDNQLQMLGKIKPGSTMSGEAAGAIKDPTMREAFLTPQRELGARDIKMGGNQFGGTTEAPEMTGNFSVREQYNPSIERAQIDAASRERVAALRKAERDMVLQSNVSYKNAQIKAMQDASGMRSQRLKMMKDHFDRTMEERGIHDARMAAMYWDRDYARLVGDEGPGAQMPTPRPTVPTRGGGGGDWRSRMAGVAAGLE